MFEENLAPDDLRKYALLLAKKCGGTAAVFCDVDGNYRYALANVNEDVRPAGKALNNAFSGRGGGSKELIQGSLKGKRKELEGFFTSKKQK